MVPQSINAYVSMAIGLATAIMTAYMTTQVEHPPLWAVLGNAGLVYLALVFKGAGLDPRGKK